MKKQYEISTLKVILIHLPQSLCLSAKAPNGNRPPRGLGWVVLK